jgi:hypothetical protein
MPNPEDGNYRYVAERRQYGGLLMVTGFCAIIQPLAGIATAVGPNGPIVSDASEVAFWSFLGSCCLFAIGVSSMIVGFIEFIMDSGEITQTTLLIILTQVRRGLVTPTFALYLALNSITNTLLSTCPVDCIYPIRERYGWCWFDHGKESTTILHAFSG